MSSGPNPICSVTGNRCDELYFASLLDNPGRAMANTEQRCGKLLGARVGAAMMFAECPIPKADSNKTGGNE